MLKRCLIFCLGALFMANPALGLQFHHRITTSLPAAQLWQYLADGLTGRDTKTFWPSHLSKIHGELREGGVLEESILGGDPLSFAISDYRDGISFTYQPVSGQWLTGRSSVTIEPTADGCALVWQGRYDIGLWSPRRLSFRVYEALFFGSLRSRIKRLESNTKATD